MSPFLQLIFILALLILVAKLAGYLSTRLGQPSVFGELLVGVLLGPSLLDVVHLSILTDTHLGEVLREIGEIGVLFLMFLAGLELDFRELARNTRVASYAGTLGVFVPVLMGWLIGLAFGMEMNRAIFLGLTLGATSVSISAQTLMELKVLRSRVGLGLLGAAVFDDILVILLLSVFTSLMGGAGGGPAILVTISRMVVYLGLAALFGLFLLPRIAHFVGKLGISQGTVTLAVVMMLVFGLTAELVGGMAAITGAFLAGMMFGRTPEKRTIEHGFSVLAFAFFVPIFFVDIGLQVNLRILGASSLWIFAVVTLVAVAGKLSGAGLGARLGGFNNREALQLGIGMISRGEVGLIVAAVGLSEGFLSDDIFSTVVGMVLVSTLITPPLLRWSFRNASENPVKEAA